MKFPHRRSRLAFTIIELLACIAIIVVLAGLVFAVYPGVVASGKKSTCVSQLKQIGYVLEMYMNDNNGDLPPYEPCQNDCSPIVFGTDLSMKTMVSVPTDPASFQASVQPYSKSHDLWWCPADSFKGQQNIGFGHTDDRYTSYTRGNLFAAILYKYRTPGHNPYSLGPGEHSDVPMFFADRCFMLSDPDDRNCVTGHGRYQTQLRLDLSIQHHVN